MDAWSWKPVVLSTALSAGGVALYTVLKKKSGSKTKGEVDNPYETAKLVNEYLAFDYGGRSVNCLFDFGPSVGFDFPKATADICLKHSKSLKNVPSRALDIGCAVGRASFELAAEYNEVIGIDYSHAFINMCNLLKEKGTMRYKITVEGNLTEEHTADISTDLERERCIFRQGDACNLPGDLGQFGCVLAANLICRLPRPIDFLLRLTDLVAPGGICVITSPYTFLTDYTAKENWLGGFVNDNGEQVRAFDTMKRVLGSAFELIEASDLPFLIRETARKHQWTVAHVTVWRRRPVA